MLCSVYIICYAILLLASGMYATWYWVSSRNAMESDIVSIHILHGEIQNCKTS